MPLLPQEEEEKQRKIKQKTVRKLRVHAQAVRGFFDTSRDCLNALYWFVNCYLVHRTEAICFAGVLWLVWFWLCINELVRHHVDFWFLACESVVDALIVFTNSHISQCFSVFRSLNDETQNWHSHRAHLVLGIVLHCGALYFVIFYSRVSRLLYVLLSQTFFVFHIPYQRNQTQRWDTLMIWPVFQTVMSSNLSTLPRCKLQEKKSSRKLFGSWECMHKP